MLQENVELQEHLVPQVKLDLPDQLAMLEPQDVTEKQEKMDFVEIMETQEDKVSEDHQEPTDPMDLEDPQDWLEKVEKQEQKVFQDRKDQLDLMVLQDLQVHLVHQVFLV